MKLSSSIGNENMRHSYWQLGNIIAIQRVGGQDGASRIISGASAKSKGMADWMRRAGTVVRASLGDF